MLGQVLKALVQSLGLIQEATESFHNKIYIPLNGIANVTYSEKPFLTTQCRFPLLFLSLFICSYIKHFHLQFHFLAYEGGSVSI